METVQSCLENYPIVATKIESEYRYEKTLPTYNRKSKSAWVSTAAAVSGASGHYLFGPGLFTIGDYTCVS